MEAKGEAIKEGRSRQAIQARVRWLMDASADGVRYRYLKYDSEVRNSGRDLDAGIPCLRAIQEVDILVLVVVSVPGLVGVLVGGGKRDRFESEDGKEEGRRSGKNASRRMHEQLQVEVEEVRTSSEVARRI